MLYREIIAVCSEIHTKHINTLCGQSVEFLIVVRKVTTGLKGLIKYLFGKHFLSDFENWKKCYRQTGCASFRVRFLNILRVAYCKYYCVHFCRCFGQSTYIDETLCLLTFCLFLHFLPGSWLHESQNAKGKKGTAIGGGGGGVKAGVEGRVHVTDCSDINIVIQSISLDFVGPSPRFSNRHCTLNTYLGAWEAGNKKAHKFWRK
jgi:hypothetical protein